MTDFTSATPFTDRGAVEAIWKEILRLPEVDPDRSFVDLGGSSLLANMLVARLAQQCGLDVPVIRVFEFPTLRQFQRFLAGELPTAPADSAPVHPADRESGTEMTGTPPGHDIAIIGMACRFPGAADLDTFWRNLVAGLDSISQLRDEQIAPSVPAEIRNDPRYVRAAGLIDDPYAMDAAFFDMPPMEARLTDPQHRVLLELSWHALENAGQVPSATQGRTAVFAGTEDNTYYKTEIHPYPEAEARAGRFSVMTGNEKDYVAMRIAHRLDLRGPAVSVHTACSTSLVAVIMACKSLRAGECEMALAGGSSVHFPTLEGYYFQEGGVFSSDGHCRPFDEAAEGTVFTDGAGMVVLKRVEDAIRDRNTIYAVIKGGAINNDGGDKVSFSAPSVRGQAACIAEALRDANVESESLEFLEAHGTATPVGDPIELEGLRRAFGDRSTRRQFCGLGSVKSNIGHTTAAAGVASLIKVALSLHHGLIPASLHFRKPNPALDIENSPFYVVDRNREWPRGGTRRRAGVSSFGIGGTNSHAVLEEAPLLQGEASEVPSRPFEILPVSARTADQRDRLLTGLSAEAAPVRDVAYTLQHGRARFSMRGAVVRLPGLPAADSVVAPPGAAQSDAELTFLFPGQGSQYIGMGRSLAASLPEFRRHYSECCRLLSKELDLDFEAFLFDPSNQETLQNTRYTQPALFAIEVSLGRTLLDWGIRPSRMIGHSIGEFAAAHLAGVFSLEDGVRMIAARGRLMAALPRGKMLSVRADAQAALAASGEAIDIASINSPVHCVLAGPEDAITRAQSRCEAAGMPCRPLHTSHAFHSSMMTPVVEPFLDVVRLVKLQPPRIRIISTVTGKVMRDEDATDPRYWAGHLRATVNFGPALRCAITEGSRLYLEVGPRATLATLAAQQLSQEPKAALSVASLGESAEPESEIGTLANALARLWTGGYELPWQSIWPDGQRVPLHSIYPFDRKVFRFSEGRSPVQAVRPGAVAGAAPAPAAPAPIEPAHALSAAQSQAETGAIFDIRVALLRDLRGIFSEFAGMEVTQEAASFIEIGFDSLVLMQIGVELGKRYGVSVSLGDLMRKHDTLTKLTAHILESASPERMPKAPAIAPHGSSEPVAIRPDTRVPDPIAQAASPAACVCTPHVAVLTQGPARSIPPITAHPALAAVIDAQMRQMREIFELQLQYATTATAGDRDDISPPRGGTQSPFPGLQKDIGQPTVEPGMKSGTQSDLAPLNLMQERIRFLEEMSPGLTVYNLPSVHRLTGPLQEQAFAQALREVIRHQGALRTLIERDPNGYWRQRVAPGIAYNLPFEDLSALSEEERSAAVQLAISDLVSRPVSTGQAPMFHAGLWRLGPQEHIFAFIPHHQIWDGWSFDLFFDELRQSYTALVDGRNPDLPALGGSYAEFAVWQQQWLREDFGREQRAYWKRLFAMLPRPVPAPSDHPRTAVRSGRGGVERLQLDSRQTERLRSIARANGSTLNMLVMAAYGAVIAHSLGLQDIVVGVTVLGRREPRFEQVIGFFSNVVPLPLRVDRRLPFAQWVGIVGGQVAEGFENQDVPFQVLSTEPELARWAGDSGVSYHALYTFLDARRRSPDLGGVALESLPVAQETATEDFGVWVTDRGNCIDFRLVHDADLFDGATASWIRIRLQTLLERIQRTPTMELAQLLSPGLHEQARIASLLDACPGVRVLDESGQDAPIGVIGSLCRNGVESGERGRWSGPGTLEVIDSASTEAGTFGPRVARQSAAATSAGPGQAQESPLSKVEALVAEVWTQVLGVSRVNPNDNFFELGGSSLLAMQAAILLEQKLGQPVNARKFTVESLRSFAHEFEDRDPVAVAPQSGRPSITASALAAGRGAGLRKRQAEPRLRGAVRRLLGGLFATGAVGAEAPSARMPLSPSTPLGDPGPATATVRDGSGANSALAGPAPSRPEPATRSAVRSDRGGSFSYVPAGAGTSPELRRAPHAQPPVPGAFRDPRNPGRTPTWYRRSQVSGEYEVM